MKKTIKYGGLIAGAATAAVATMSGAPVFAETMPTGYTAVDATTCEITWSATSIDIVAEETTAADTAAAYKAKADAHNAQAACYGALAGDVAMKIAANAEIIGVSTGDYDVLEAAAVAKLDSITSFKDTDFTSDTTSLVDLKAVLTTEEVNDDGDTAWYLAKEAHPELNDTYLLTEILNNADNAYGQDDIISDYYTAKAAWELIGGKGGLIAEYNKYANLAKEATATAEAALETATETAEAAAEYAKEAAAGARNVADYVQIAINNLADNENVDSEIIEALQAALDQIKVSDYDEEAIEALLEKLGDVVEELSDTADELAEAADAAEAARDAKQAALDAIESAITTAETTVANAKADAETKNDAVTTKKAALMVAETTAKEKKTAYEEAKAAYEETSIPPLKSAMDAAKTAWDNAEAAVTTAKEELGTAQTALKEAQDKLDEAEATLASLKTSKTTTEEELAAAEKALVAAEKAADEASDLHDSVARVAGGVVAAAEAKADAVEAAEIAAEAEAVLDGKPDDDNKGSDDTTYSYTTLSDSETAYVEGNDLVLHFDAPFADFEYLAIDGVIIDSSMYMVEAGSTKITLSSTLLDTLKEGEHTVIAYYAGDKTATAKFTIVSATVDTAKTVKTPDTGVYTAETSGATNSLAGLLGAITAATLAGAVVVLRKRAA